MNKIEVKILNEDAITDGERMLVAGARLTQRGHNIKSMADFMALYRRHYSEDTVKRMCELPHPNIQRFAFINVAIVGASRRFLAQITRHQDDVHFISASLQYSDYSDNGAFCVPYELMVKDSMHAGQAQYEEHYYVNRYLRTQQQAMAEYEQAIKQGVDNDSAGYMMPHGLRNVIVIGATPFQWKHMIAQRVCRRNTPETAYVMNLVWEALIRCSSMFDNAGPFCTEGACKEGRMSCKHFYQDVAVSDYMEAHNCFLPTAFLDVNYLLIRQQYAPGCAEVKCRGDVCDIPGMGGDEK